MSKFFLRSLCLASIVLLTACSSSSSNLATGPSAAATPAQQTYIPLPVARLTLQMDNSGSVADARAVHNLLLVMRGGSVD
ncbi:MAG TPA: hypothetical protein VFA38_04485, partial [Nitrospirales bacterium]|nr:hypothetical protein [Nitrospirales bacterium]